MAKRNPFKKKSLTDTLVNVAIGGAANVAIDYIEKEFNVPQEEGNEKPLSDTVVNVIKIGLGAVVGGMVENQMARAAADGVAVVGVSNLISGLIADSAEGTSGIPYGTIGSPVTRVRLGNKYFKKAAKKAGFTVDGSFLGK
ncbi:MAG: hypothetical protein IJW01_00645 [Paludibacteraceae bacterium]|nr:hypothetical protein [Paludibacteraceae bacterium]